MLKSLFSLLFVCHLTMSVLGYPAASDNGRLKDLDASETFWEAFNSGGGRGYSGWGTGVQVQPSPVPAVYGTYGTYGQAYGNPTAYGAYGTYGNYGGTYGAYNPSNYYGKYPMVYAGYNSQQPTYENYGVHGGHGFGKYGNY